MKKMLITGTTQGIGYDLYHKFSKEYEIYTINRKPFNNVNNFICDLSNLESLQQLCDKLSTIEFDILINNAGGAFPSDLENLTIEELIRCTNLNYLSPIMIMKAVLPRMKKNNYGRIVNVSSIASKSPRPLLPHYGAAKAALENFSKSIAVAYANCGISINCICPGGVETNTSIKNRKIISKLSSVEENYYNNNISKENGLGRMVKTSEVINLIEFLIKSDSPVISGQIINICGIKEVH